MLRPLTVPGISKAAKTNFDDDAVENESDNSGKKGNNCAGVEAVPARQQERAGQEVLRKFVQSN